MSGNLSVLLWFWLLLPIAPARAQLCVHELAAQAPLRDDDGFISMEVAIGGLPARLLVDTGSDEGLITEAGAARLGLARDPLHRTLIQGTGGTGRVAPDVLLPDIRIGRMRLPGGSVALGSLPGEPMVDPPVAGLLGAHQLSRFDLEFDLPHHRISFWRIRLGSVACAPPPAWSGGFDSLPLVRQGNRMRVAVELNGRTITALVDTGARSRILSVRAALRLGVGTDRLGVDPGGITAGMDGREVEYHWHRFGRLAVGRELEAHPVLTVAPLAEQVDLLLGADWFAAHDVWISYAADRLFVRPAGVGQDAGP